MIDRNIDEDRYMPFEVGDEICLIEYVMYRRSSYSGWIRYISEDYYRSGGGKDKNIKKKIVLGKWNEKLNGYRNVVRGVDNILEKLLCDC